MHQVDGSNAKADLPAIIRRVAQSIGKSFEVYWPADENGANDPKEKNLSFHFAHVLLTDSFFVFAEANHPNHQGLDLLAISPHRDFFIACEFKRHISNSIADSIPDLNRVASFSLNQKLRIGRVGENTMQTLSCCRTGIGLVAGLKWTSQSVMKELDRTTQFARLIVELKGEIGKPEHVTRWNCDDVTGSYYIQYATFPLPCS
ncbi:MAG: hypothetical protein WD872_12955 [Pirellulaceae bacterium]